MAVQIVGEAGLLLRGVTDERSFNLSDADRRRLLREGERAGREAGRGAGREFGDGLGQGSRQGTERTRRRVRDDLEDAGRDGGRRAGREAGEGLDRGSRQGTDRTSRRVREELGESGRRGGRDAAGRFTGEMNKGIKAGMRSVAVGAAAILGGALLVKGFADAASDLEESTSKVGVVFGDSAEKVQAFARTASTSLGQAEGDVLAATGTFGNLLRAVGLAEEEAADLSIGMAQLATDLASFNNADPTEVLEALRSGLVGETEPLKRFGINLNAARLEAEAMKVAVAAGKDEIDQASKTQAAYNLILDDTTLAQGDFARTSDGFANQQRIAAAAVEDLQVQIGGYLLPVFTRAVTFFNERAVPALGALVEGLAEVGGWLAENEGLVYGLVTAIGVLNATRIGQSAVSALTLIADKAKAARDAVGGRQGLVNNLGKIGKAGAAAGLAVLAFESVQAAEGIDQLATAARESDRNVGGSLAEQVKARRAGIDAVRERLDDLSRAGEEGDNIFRRLAERATDYPTLIAGNFREATGDDLRLGVEESERLLQRQEAIFRAAADTLAERYGTTLPQAFKVLEESGGTLGDSFNGLVIRGGELIEKNRAIGDEAPQLQEAIAAVGDETLTASEKVDALRTSLDLLLGRQLAVPEATAAVNESIAALADESLRARDAIDKQTGAADLNTESGRALFRANADIARGAADLAAAVFEQTGDVEQSTEAWDLQRDAFIRAQRAAGRTKEEAEALAEQVGLVPRTVETAFSTPGLVAANSAAKTLLQTINGLDGRRNVIVSYGTQGLGDVTRQFQRAGRGSYAAGGRVQNLSGRGRQPYDTELAMLRVDEHVWTPEEVDAAGGHGAMERMRQRAREGRLRGFARGGPVTFSTTGAREALQNAQRVGLESRAFTDRLVAAAQGMMHRVLDSVVETLGTVAESGFLNPLARGSYRISSRYGPRGGGFHGGIDLAAPIGTLVRSPIDGFLRGVNLGNRSYGLYGDVSAGSTRVILAHLSSLIRGNGPIRRGEPLGRVGSTGNSTGPHLHLEVRRGGRSTNPEGLFRFANGGFTTRPTRALLSEFGQREVVLPLDKPDRTAELLRQAGLATSGPVQVINHFHDAADPGAVAHAVGVQLGRAVRSGAAGPLRAGAR